ncbi:MAG: YHS domain-containing (seleno)protein [Gemmatimonadota bacterium]
MVAFFVVAPRGLQGQEQTREGRAITGGVKRLVNIDGDKIAIKGYDPVAYFRQHKPMKGSSEHQVTFGGAIFYFASVENQKLFEQDPPNYAPQFGGFCGWAASQNYVYPGDPEIWQIQNGRLILNAAKSAQEKYNADPAGNLIKADGNWPGLVEKKGSSVP